MDQNTIIGLLTGSLATLLIKGLIEYLSKKTEHKRELFSITYQRQLELAEKATSYYYTYFSQIQHTKKAIQSLIKATNDDSELDADMLGGIVKDCGASLTKLETENFHQINAIHLYFELDNVQDWNEQDVSELLENAAVATFKSNEIMNWTNALESLDENSESDEEEYYTNKIKEALPGYTSSLQKFVDSLEKNKNAIYKTINELRRQLKIKNVS